MTVVTSDIYSQNYFFSSANVLIRLPKNSDMAWDRYVTPFSYGLWLAVAIVACALGVCLVLINYGHERNQNLTVSTIFFYVHACFCQQGQRDKSCCLTLLVCISFLVTVQQNLFLYFIMSEFIIPIFLKIPR